MEDEDGRWETMVAVTGEPGYRDTGIPGYKLSQ
jgi:hypothetical protein